MTRITYQEITGYFNFEMEGYRFEFGNGNVHHAYPCLQCFAVVCVVYSEDHIRWHKGIHKPDKDKTPVEIRAEAKRELGRLKNG